MRYALLGLGLLLAAGCTGLLGDDFNVVATDGGGGARGGASAGGGGTGEGGQQTGSGPQLVGSTPENGAREVSVVPFGRLFFDRPIDLGAATGKIRIASPNVPAGEIAQVQACTEGGPTCLEYVFPTSLVIDGVLPPDTKLTVTVDKSLPDADNNINDVDASVSYTTFGYRLGVVTDLPYTKDFAGVGYAANPNALFVAGNGSMNNSGPDVIRIALNAEGAPTGWQHAAQPNIFSLGTCSGTTERVYQVDAQPSVVFLSASACNGIVVLDLDAAGAVTSTRTFSATFFDAPDNRLFRAETALRDPTNGNYLFGAGNFGNGPALSGIPEYRPKYQVAWEQWLSRSGSFDADDAFYLTGGVESGEFFVYLANGPTLIKIRHSDKKELNRHTTPGVRYDSPTLRSDSKGRLYVGTEDGLIVYDSAGFNGFKVLAERMGLNMQRFAVRERNGGADVYFADFGGTGGLHQLGLRFE